MYLIIRPRAKQNFKFFFTIFELLSGLHCTAMEMCKEENSVAMTSLTKQ